MRSDEPGAAGDKYVSFQLSVVSCQLSVVSCQLSVVSGQWSANRVNQTVHDATNFRRSREQALGLAIIEIT